ncbi:hypothetical protein U9M48_004020, partial [Paspalum notatum var. saurae]
MWDSMIEKVKKEIYLWKGKELNEDSTLYSVIYDILIARWTKGNNPLHCMAHSLNPRLYNIQYSLIHKHDEGVGCVPPHKDKEVSQIRMQCFKKFFRNPEKLAQVKEEYSRFSSCSEEFNDPDSIHDRFSVSPMTANRHHPLAANETGVLTALSIMSKKNALTVERAEDLVFVRSNLRHLSRKTDAYKKGETRLCDISGDAWDSMGGVDLLEVADLSLDKSELQGISFGVGALSIGETSLDFHSARVLNIGDPSLQKRVLDADACSRVTIHEYETDDSFAEDIRIGYDRSPRQTTQQSLIPMSCQGRWNSAICTYYDIGRSVKMAMRPRFNNTGNKHG